MAPVTDPLLPGATVPGAASVRTSAQAAGRPTGGLRIVRDVRTLLRRDLTAAMKVRDTVAVAALRSFLAAIDDAEAVDPDVGTSAPGAHGPHVAGGTSGLGSGEVQRRTLSEDALAALLRAHLEELRASAREFAQVGRVDLADRLRAEAEVIGRYAGSAGPSDPAGQPPM